MVCGSAPSEVVIKKGLCARIRRDPHFYWGSAKTRSRSYEPLRLPQVRDHQCLSAFKGESVCTNRAHRKHLVTPAQATHRSRVRRGEEGDRAPQWLATTTMLPPPDSSSMATDRPQPGFKVFHEISAAHDFAGSTAPCQFQRCPPQNRHLPTGPTNCRIPRIGRNHETPANRALRQIPAQSPKRKALVPPLDTEVSIR